MTKTDISELLFWILIVNSIKSIKALSDMINLSSPGYTSYAHKLYVPQIIDHVSFYSPHQIFEETTQSILYPADSAISDHFYHFGDNLKRKFYH